MASLRPPLLADTDRLALETLKRIPLLPMVIQKFYEVGIDRWLYCYNMSMSVRCGPNQYKTLYNILRDSCDVLDMPELCRYRVDDRGAQGDVRPLHAACKGVGKRIARNVKLRLRHVQHVARNL